MRSLNWVETAVSLILGGQEYEVEKVVLKRGLGYYINKFIYIKNRDSGFGLILRCQNRNHCHAKAIIKKENGKAIIKQGRHTHGPPAFRNIIFCTTEDDALIPSTSGAPESSGIGEFKVLKNFFLQQLQMNGHVGKKKLPLIAHCFNLAITEIAEKVSKLT